MSNIIKISMDLVKELALNDSLAEFHRLIWLISYGEAALFRRISEFPQLS